MRRWDPEPEEDVEAKAVPAFELVGWRHKETGTLRSARFVQHELDQGEYEPVYTGGPETIAPLLAAAIALAEDRTDGYDRVQQFHFHRLQAQIALGEFVARGGEIP